MRTIVSLHRLSPSLQKRRAETTMLIGFTAAAYAADHGSGSARHPRRGDRDEGKDDHAVRAVRSVRGRRGGAVAAAGGRGAAPPPALAALMLALYSPTPRSPLPVGNGGVS